MLKLLTGTRTGSGTGAGPDSRLLRPIRTPRSVSPRRQTSVSVTLEQDEPIASGGEFRVLCIKRDDILVA